MPCLFVIKIYAKEATNYRYKVKTCLKLLIFSNQKQILDLINI